MHNNLINLLESKFNIKSGRHPSVLTLASVYAIAFIVVLAILNGPLIVSLILYPLTHSEEADNERLTAQYIALYGGHVKGEQSIQDSQQAAPVAQAAIAPIWTPVPSVTTAPAIKATSQNSISISKINISAPILQVSVNDEKTILNALKSGVVLYPDSAYPGQNGSTVIVGHSSSNPPWTKYSAIFSLLNKLVPDDLINISFDGKEYIYRVRTKEKGSVQHILDSGLGGDLVLTSCWPVGTDQGRIVVVADLVR